MKEASFSEKRTTIRKKKETEVYETVLKYLEESIALKNEGKEEESQTVYDNMLKDLESRIEKMQEHKPETDVTKMDRSSLPDSGKILAENKIILLKMVSMEERDLYIEVSYDCSSMKSYFTDEEFKKNLWGDFIKEYSITASIYDKATGTYVGYCRVKDIRRDDWELAIEEKAEYRNKGFGFSAVQTFISRITELTGNRFYRARVDIDNIASQKLWKRLGFYPNGISEFLLHGEELIQFQKENVDSINDSIRSIAEEFCMDPEDLIGYVLEYRLDTAHR